ncbi:MAG: DUF1552 domain-containing protein [Planctomycetota bacterium]
MNKRLHRRTLLRGAGTAIALPFLDAMLPSAFADPTDHQVKRLVFLNLHLGFMERNFTPRQPGRDYQASKYLKVIDEFRDDYTVITGTSHPGVNGAHTASVSFLTAAPDAASASFKNSISVDQVAAEHMGDSTRFAYLPLGLDSRSMSFSRSGANLPAIHQPSELYQRLFVSGTPRERARTKQRLNDGQSIMDFVADSAKSVSRRLGPRDREKLDAYFNNVRETEKRLMKSREWLDIPKPRSGTKPPKNIQDRSDFISKIALMYDMIALALESDSTRVVTFNQPNLNDVLPFPGVSQGYHSLSHHNGDPEKIRQLELVEIQQMRNLHRLLGRLQSTHGSAGTLLDESMVMVGSIFGDANRHDTNNMPIVLAGGGFKHGQHLAFDPEHNQPTANLYVSMLQQAGVSIDAFASSNGTLTGLT